MTCTYFRIIIHSTAYHHLQITWLSYFGSENQGLPLRSWFVTCWLWRHIPIVTSLAVPSSCVVTQTPMGTNSGTRRRKRKFLLLFVNCDRGRIEIDHLYGLCCRGWYCNPEQHSLCRPARPRDGRHNSCCSGLQYQPLQHRPYRLSWSIPIAKMTRSTQSCQWWLTTNQLTMLLCKAQLSKINTCQWVLTWGI